MNGPNRPPMAQAIRQFVARMEQPAKHKSEIAGTVLALLQFSKGLAADAMSVTVSPSLSQVAEILWCSKPSVRRRLKRVRDAGLITHKGRGHASTLYTIHRTRQQADRSPVDPSKQTDHLLIPLNSQTDQNAIQTDQQLTPSGVVPLEKERSKPNTHVFDVPGWVPDTEWKAFLEVRKRKRAPNTGRALQLIIGKLDRLRSDGQEVSDILDQSTERGWTGVFPVKQSAAKPSRHTGFDDKDYRAGLTENSDGTFRL